MDKLSFKEEYISTKEELKGRFLHFRIDEIKLPDGRHGEREYVKHGGAVAVIPVDDEGNVYVVRQYRYAVGEVTTEIPAGKLDSPDEDKLSAALRELREETGLTAKNVKFIGKYAGSPAINSEIIWLYFATGLTSGEQELDDDEFLGAEKMPLSELCELVMKGEIPDGKTAFAALWADKYLRERE